MHASQRRKFTLSLLAVLSILGVVEAFFNTLFPASSEALTRFDSFFSTDAEQYPALLEQQQSTISPGVERIPLMPSFSALYQYSRGQINLAQAYARGDGNADTVNLGSLCAALADFTQASRRSPANPRYHLAVAAAASRLRMAGGSCSEIAETASPDALRELAVARLSQIHQVAPYDTALLYLSAVVYLSLDLKEQGMELLKLSQEINPFFSEEQRNFFYGLVFRGEDLQRVLSGDLADVIGWANYFLHQHPGEYERWKHVIVAGIEQNLVQLPSTFDPKLEADRARFLELQSLERHPIVLESDSIRQRIDAWLARAFTAKDQESWATVLLQRSRLFRIPVLKALSSKDSQPKSSMLFGWKLDLQDELVRFARSGFSLGIYLPPDQSVRMIVLENEHIRWKPRNEEVEIRVSNDNLDFDNLRTPYQFHVFHVSGHEVLVLRFTDLQAKYVKLSYRSHDPGVLKNDLPFLLQVYGTVKNEPLTNKPAANETVTK